MPVFAGNRIYASDLNRLASASSEKPVVRLVAQSAQALADNTETAILFGAGSEVQDTHGWHDTAVNTSRVTPTIAGTYEVSGTVYFAARADYASIAAGVRLNGNTQHATHRHGPNATSSVRSVTIGPVKVQCNGTSDYIELIGLQDNTASAAGSTHVSAPSSASVLEVTLVRLT